MDFHLLSAAEARGDKRVSDESLALGYAVGLFGWFLLGGVFVAGKAGSAEMPPWMFVSVRLFIATVVLLPLVRHHFKDMRAFLPKFGLRALIIGAIGLGLTQGLVFVALRYTTAVNSGIVFAICPMITLILAHTILREDLGPLQIIGSIVAFAGIIVIAVKGSFASLLALDIGIGDLLVLVAALCFSIYTVMLKRSQFKLDRMALLTILMTGGFLLSLPLTIWEVTSGEHEQIGWTGVIAMAYIAIPGGALMYLMINWSIDILGASRAGALLYSQMVFTAFLAWLILGESIEWYHFVGAGLVVVGIVVISRHRAAASAAGR
ncbi:DMT family transporter [Bauldia sp.]|uniref:DMT family transporter n=1 Tax=Bauldia sp. TaxID=2575872 RepID=UPI003BAA7079